MLLFFFASAKVNDRIIGRPLLLNFFREGLPIRRVYSLIWRNRASKHRLSRLIEGFSLCASSVLVMASKVKANSGNIDDVTQKADELYLANKMPELYEFLNEYKDSDNVEIRWRLARVCYKVGKYYTPDKKRAQDLAQEGLLHAEKAIGLDSSHFAGYKWMGIILSWSSDFEGYKKKIECSFDVKDYFVKSIQLNPEDPTCKHLLGQWCFSVSDVPWYMRKAAKYMFATPPSSTFEEALEHFLNAEKTKPGFYSTNWLFIGKCYLRLGNKAEAREWLCKAASHVSDVADDKEAKAEAVKLLASL